MPVEAANRKETARLAENSALQASSFKFGSITLMTLNRLNPTIFDSATVVWPVWNYMYSSTNGIPCIVFKHPQTGLEIISSQCYVLRCCRSWLSMYPGLDSRAFFRLCVSPLHSPLCRDQQLFVFVRTVRTLILLLMLAVCRYLMCGPLSVNMTMTLELM